MEPIFYTLEIEDISECFTVIKKLGQGTYGHVLLAQKKITGEPVAVKLLRKDRTKFRSFFVEASLSIFLSEHPGIITTQPILISTMDYYVMTQELATAGTLHHIIQPQVGIPEDAVKRCAVQISRALDYMHGRGLVHGDLKPDNVFLMDRDCYNVKLGDFGFTQYAGSLVASMKHIIPYMSPELCDIKDDEHLILSPSIDTWAFGVLLFVTLTGYFPWRQATEKDMKYKVYSYWRKCPAFTPPPVIWNKLTCEALNMLNKLLAQDPSFRHSALIVLNDLNLPWKADVSKNDTEGEKVMDLEIHNRGHRTV